MGWMNRRDFMARTAGSVVAGLALSNLGVAVQTPVKASATAKRTLGKTGIRY